MKTFFQLVKIALLAAILGTLIAINDNVSAQQWQYENKGLYPQSLNLTYNARNTGLGIRYGYLLQNEPIGFYGGFSHTIKPDMRYNSYPWERRFTLGGSLTVPNRHPEIHIMFTAGGAYNWHEDVYKYHPGSFDPKVSQTNNFGVDVGIQAQMRHQLYGFDLGMLSDIWYCSIRAGVTFIRLRR